MRLFRLFPKNAHQFQAQLGSAVSAFLYKQEDIVDDTNAQRWLFPF